MKNVHPAFDLIPSHWRLQKASRVLDLSVGGTPPTSNPDYFDGDVPWLTIAGMKAETIYECDKSLTPEGVKAANINWTYPGDLLYSFKLSIGKVAWAGVKMVTNEAIASIHPSSDIHLPYAKWVLPMAFQAAAGTNIYGALLLNQEQLRQAMIPIPPRREQKLIADYLDRETAEIDAFLHDQNLLIELLRERRLAQLARDVAGSDSSLVENDVPWAPGLKTPYPTVNIRRVAEMKTGHTPNRNKPEYWLETDIPWFTLADVWQLRAGNKFLGETTEMISNVGLANSAADLLPAGTVVLSRTASVGFTGIMPRPMATSQDYWNWVCGPDILPEYLWFQFRAMRPEFDRIKSGSTHKTIYKADAAALTLVLPPLEDQQEIVQRLTAVDEELAAAEEDVLASIQLAQERRSALISAAVTGQIDVTAQGVAASEQLRDELEVHV